MKSIDFIRRLINKEFNSIKHFYNAINSVRINDEEYEQFVTTVKYITKITGQE